MANIISFSSTGPRRSRRSAHSSVLVALFVFGSSLTSSGCEAAGGDTSSAASETAPRFVVGTAGYDWIDSGRPELLTPDEDDLREVVVRAWYPAAASGSERAPYFLNRLQAELNAQAAGLPADTFSHLELPARVDAPLAPSSRPFPVLIFSPGMGTAPEFYGFQLAELASRGYVVFALAHSYATGHIVLADGHVAPELPEAPEDGVRDLSVATWSQDQRFVWSRVAELASATSGDRMSGRLDLARVGAFGHSRGGSAAAQTCLDDARFLACANLDGSVSSRVMTGSIRQPFLLLRSELSEGTLETFFAQLEGRAHRVVVAGAGHNNFSDLPRILRDLQLNLDPEALLFGSIEPERAFEIQGAYVSAFFDAELRGAPNALFFEPPPFAEVTVTNTVFP